MLYVANGAWVFGDGLCRANAWVQQFVFLKMAFALVLMAIERALGLMSNGRHLVTPKYLAMVAAVFLLVALSFSMPLAFPAFPVSNSPIVYTIVQILVYGGCLFVLLICFGSLLRHKNQNRDRSLPVRPQDYGEFIMESRALQDHLSLGRLVLFMTLAYVFVQGPYIILSFFLQIRNSSEWLKNDEAFETPQDAETLITWLKFFYPLIVPVLILASCHDIWTKFVNLLLCRRSSTGVIGWSGYDRPQSSYSTMGTDNVLTLVATDNGLQLHVPQKNPLYGKAQGQVHSQSDMSYNHENQPSERSSVENSRMYGNDPDRPKARKAARSQGDGRDRSPRTRTTSRPAKSKKTTRAGARNARSRNNQPSQWKY
ncbi:GPCR protein [Aphelenchoides avenae]|nr:GPCR protein [Aphelenchus avenae]